MSAPTSLGFNDPDGHRLKAIQLMIHRKAQMRSNQAALPRPPWYALGETLGARQARIFDGNPEYAFTCPKCHGHEFGTQCDTKDSSGWRVYCHHNICVWNGPYQEHVYKSAVLPKPPAYARALGEMRNLLERPEGMKRREPYDAPDLPGGTLSHSEVISAAAKTLFAQLREMGVGCETCTKVPCGIEEDEDDPFLCSAWIGIDGWEGK